MSSATRARAEEIVKSFLGRMGKGEIDLTDTTSLYGDGLELDSLEVAELSALLEDEFGSDPFSSDGSSPEVAGDVYAFYDTVDAG